MRKKILLRDVDGAREFIDHLVDAAETIAISLTGVTGEETRSRLEVTRTNLARDLGPEIGAEAAAQVADIFCRAVLSEKAERKALAAMALR
jgi:hypothetical protein